LKILIKDDILSSTLGDIVLLHLFLEHMLWKGGSAMRVKLGIALAYLEKAAAIVAIVVPALRGVASVMGVGQAEAN
jgi:hypothetical protein